MKTARLEREWQNWIDRLEQSLGVRNSRLTVPRKPAVKADVLTILSQAAGDLDVEQYLFQEASIEAAKMIVLGWTRMMVALNARGPEAQEIRRRLRTYDPDGPTLKELCLLCVEFWPAE